MPGGDGTGPFGTYVNCIPVNNREYFDINFVRFWRRGFGRGFGRMTFFNPRGLLRSRYMLGYWSPPSAITKEQEIGLLREQRKILEQNIKGIEKRIDELSK